MDVTPPSTLRRLGLALAGLAVAALTGAACALSFNDLRDLAIQGKARPDLAFLYPSGFDALLLVALIGVLLLSSGRMLARVQAAAVLVLLILAAIAVNLAKPLQVQVDVRQAAIGLAVAPWVMLAIALWLWLLMIKHVQARKTRPDEQTTPEPDIVPFPEPQPIAVSERVTRWSPEPPEAEEPPETEEPEAVEEPVEEPEEPPEPQQEEEPEEELTEDRPIRWGDRVERTDVLVHPRTERDADTQPVRVFAEETIQVNPDPGHGPEAADETEPVLGPGEAPADDAPSGRLRSTPRPPEE